MQFCSQKKHNLINMTKNYYLSLLYMPLIYKHVKNHVNVIFSVSKFLTSTFDLRFPILTPCK